MEPTDYGDGGNLTNSSLDDDIWPEEEGAETLTLFQVRVMIMTG